MNIVYSITDLIEDFRDLEHHDKKSQILKMKIVLVFCKILQDLSK